MRGLDFFVALPGDILCLAVTAYGQSTNSTTLCPAESAFRLGPVPRPVQITRTVSAGRVESHNLRFVLGGQDLTQQSVKETQVGRGDPFPRSPDGCVFLAKAIPFWRLCSDASDPQERIDDALPVAVLADAVFHSQHLVTGLLDKTDRSVLTDPMRFLFARTGFAVHGLDPTATVCEFNAHSSLGLSVWSKIVGGRSVAETSSWRWTTWSPLKCGTWPSKGLEGAARRLVSVWMRSHNTSHQFLLNMVLPSGHSR